jgi:chromosomal replication initiation ATPase DnaA
MDELNYDKVEMTSLCNKLMSSMTDEQLVVFNSIISAMKEDSGVIFFLYGYEGTGKTYIWNSLSASLRFEGKIVLNVVSSGIASLLLLRGRTTYSRFSIH